MQSKGAVQRWKSAERARASLRAVRQFSLSFPQPRYSQAELARLAHAVAEEGKGVR